MSTPDDDDDGPPPLEDMSAQIAAFRLRTAASAPRSAPATSSSAVKSVTPVAAIAKDSASAAPTPSPAASAVTVSAPAPAKSTSGSGSSKGMFGGLAGGFFNRPPAKTKPSTATTTSSISSSTAPAPVTASTTTTATASDVPVIRAAAPASSLRMDEVQDAMKDVRGVSAELTSEPFLRKLLSNPKLRAGLENPRIAHAMTEIGANPAAAMKKYQTDTELTSFIAEYMKFMGEHLASKEQERQKTQSEEESKAKEAAALKPVTEHRHARQPQPQQQQSQRSVDPAQMQRWMSDPRIRAALDDPSTSAMLTQLQSNPSLFPRVLQHPNIQLLVQAGILLPPPEYAHLVTDLPPA